MKPLEPLIGLSLLPTPYRAVLCCAVLMLFMLSDDTPPQYYIAYIETSLYFSHIFNFFFFFNLSGRRRHLQSTRSTS